MKKNKGITLVALVVTIIILLILAGVAISMITGGEGIFAQANGAATKYNQAAKNEADLINQLLNGNYLNNSGNGQEEGPTINSESHVGYYADIEGDGKIDGIIFADMTKGVYKQTEDGGYYLIEPLEGELKEYYVSKKEYKGIFGTKDVLSPKEKTTGKDRFYVMDLEDFSTSGLPWWSKLISQSGTADNLYDVLGNNGRYNTTKVIECWNEGKIGDEIVPKSENDMWGVIQEQVNEGWFVPSWIEWEAFSLGLEIAEDKYPSYGLCDDYLTSNIESLTGYFAVTYVFLDGNGFNINSFESLKPVRLATTF